MLEIGTLEDENMAVEEENAPELSDASDVDPVMSVNCVDPVTTLCVRSKVNRRGICDEL